MITVAPQRSPRIATNVSPAAMHVRCFTTMEQWLAYTDDWDRLAAGVPFRGWTWLSHWWRCYGPPNGVKRRQPRMAVLGVFDDAGSLRGIAPWYVDHSALQGRVLRPLGSGEVCSDYLGVLCDPPVEDAVAKALAGYLVDFAHDRSPDALRWDLLDTDAVDAEDAVMASLVDHLSAYGCTVHRRPGMNCWRLELTTDWDQYLASLGRHLRGDLRRLGRDMFDTGRVVLRSPAGLDDLPRAMEILVDLHQRRWTAVGEPGCFASERFNAFFRDVVPAMHRLGQLQFHWLELDGKPIAARYELIVDGVVYAYQSGVDPTVRT